MGKRKKSSSKPMGKKGREPLATTFQCLFCNHERSVTVKLERKVGVGQLFCKVCGQTFQTNINYISAAVDVYADWVDACDAVAKETTDTTDKAALNSYRDLGHTSRPVAGASIPEEGDGFVVEDDMDAEGEFADDE